MARKINIPHPADNHPAERPIPTERRFAPRSKKPLGLPTRGKTAPNRLRPTDAYLALCYPGFLRALPGVYVDLGFGQFPSTTVETAARLRRLNPGLRIVGVEIDPERVAGAEPWAGPGLEFRLGGLTCRWV